MESFETIRLEREGDVLVATIDRPGNDLNAVDATLHEELGGLFRLLKRERSARAVLLTGSKRAFTAGGDFGWFPQLRDRGASTTCAATPSQLIWDLLDVELPIVAAVNGPAIGLGASIALLCDVIVMADTAVDRRPAREGRHRGRRRRRRDLAAPRRPGIGPSSTC